MMEEIGLPPKSLGLGSPGLDLLFHEQYQRRLGLYLSMEIGSDHDIRSEIRHVLDILQPSARVQYKVRNVPGHPHDPILSLLIHAVVEQSP
jgi:hypothetical protein